jgi:hypothetical protein
MISDSELTESGWIYKGRCPFTGKRYFYKDKHMDDLGGYSETFIYYPDEKIVKYSENQFSNIKRNVDSIEYLNEFYKILKHE